MMFGDKEENNNYISLQEATKHCLYTQEYLSLRARQGKLKSVKFGRNWVTTKEWLDDYLAGVMEYSNNLKNNKKIPKEEIKKESLTPENLPVGEIKLVKVSPFYAQIIDGLKSPEFRFGVVFLITLTLIITGVFFEKDSFREVAVVISAPIKESFVSVYEDIENEFSKLGKKINEDEIYSATIYGTIDTYQEYFEWLGKTLGEQISKVKNSTPILAVEKTAKNVWNVAKTGYTIADNFIEEKISAISDGLSGLYRRFTEGGKTTYQFVVQLRTKKVTEEKISEDLTKDIGLLKQELQELKEKGLQVKEIIKEVQVSKVTKVEPVREVTKEIVKISDAALSNLRAQVVEFANWRADIENLKAITQKLQANPANTYASTAPIYIASQGLQVGGAGSFTSLGVSGPLGAKDLGVSDSTTLGSISSDLLTVKATPTFEALVTAQAGLTIGTGATAYALPVSTGTAGQAIKIDGSGNVSWGSVAGSPGGSTGQIQYNSAGVFGGASQFYYDATNDRVGIGTSGPDTLLDVLATSGSQLRLTYTDGSVYSGFTVDASGDLTITATGGDISFGNENLTTTGTGRFSTLAVGTAYTFPTTDGSANQVLQTNGSGTVSWVTISVSADVTGVGDCTGGDCFDGTIDGGTWLKFYDAQGAGQLITGDLSQIRTWTLPDATGTVITTGNLSSITSTGTITSGTWRGTAVEPGYGGTGLSSYATGDMLYSSGPTTFSKLAIGSSNYILTSSGTAPQWSNTLSISGLTVSGLTSGRVPYATTGGQLTDSANLTFDGTTLTAGGLTTSGTLAAGTTNISGLATFSYTPQGTAVGQGSLYLNPATATADYTLLGLAVGGTEKFRVDAEGDIVKTGNITMADLGWIGLGSSAGLIGFDDSTTDYVYFSNANIGIGTATPDAKLHLGETRTSGTIQKLSYPAATTLAGAVYGLDMDLSTNVTQGSNSILGLRMKLPSTGTADRIFSQFIEGSTTFYNFKTTQAVIDVPVSFGSAGDVAISYDLQFTNDTASYIKSYGPLYIEAGDPNFNRDLTFRAAGSGSVIVNDTFLVQNTSNSTTAYQFANAAGTTILDIDTTNQRVGIGSTSPDRLFHVELSDTATSDVSYIGRFTHISSATGDAGFGAGLEFELENASGTNRVASAIQSVWEDATNATEDASLRFLTIQNGTLTEAMRIDDNGNIGIGTTGPTAKLTIQIAATPDAHLDLNPITDTPTANVTEGDIYMDDDGILYIRSNTAWAAANAAADFSELIVPLDFQKEISAGARRYVGEIEAGDVIVINSDGNYERSSKPYDLRVAGVESGNRGQYLLQEGTPERAGGQRQIGIIGHLLVKVSNENGPIEAGDFLTTSSLQGYAMKATEPGAVVAKAFEPFDGSQGETGQIEVFVNAGWYGGQLTENGMLVEEETTEETEILESFVQKIKQALASLGLFIQNGIAQAKEFIAEKITAKTIRAERMEMIDQRTGDIYCTWIEYGETKKVRGECDTIDFGTTEINNSQFPIPPEGEQAPYGAGNDQSNPNDQNPIEEISDTSDLSDIQPSLPEIPAVETTSPSTEGAE